MPPLREVLHPATLAPGVILTPGDIAHALDHGQIATQLNNVCDPAADFGADPTGATDSTAAFAAMSAALSSTGGGVMDFGPGLFVGSLVVPENVWLRAEWLATQLRPPIGSTVPVVDVPNCINNKISDIFIRGNGATGGTEPGIRCRMTQYPGFAKPMTMDTVLVWQSGGNAFDFGTFMIESQFNRLMSVEAYGTGIQHNSTDCYFSNCSVGVGHGPYGVVCAGAKTQWVNCLVWAQKEEDPNSIGWYIATVGQELTGCMSNDNRIGMFNPGGCVAKPFLSVGDDMPIEIDAFPSGPSFAEGNDIDLMLLRADRWTAQFGFQLQRSVRGRYQVMANWTGGPANRADSCGTVSGSPVVTDAHIGLSDQGATVTGSGVPASTYVGTVTPGVSFRLSSSATSQVDVNATATASPVVLVVHQRDYIDADAMFVGFQDISLQYPGATSQDAGNVMEYGNEDSNQIFTATGTPTITPELANGFRINVILDADVTINAPAHHGLVAPSKAIQFAFSQAGGGNHKVTWNVVYNKAPQPSPELGAISVISFYNGGTTPQAPNWIHKQAEPAPQQRLWTPKLISGLVQLHEADALTGIGDGAPVASWPDQSGAGIALVQATALNQPRLLVQGIGSLPSLRFAIRTDPSCGTTSGSPTVTDGAISAGDIGQPVSGSGIPANTFVGTVTPGTSFLLSSSATSQVNVNATATATVGLVIGAKFQALSTAAFASAIPQPFTLAIVCRLRQVNVAGLVQAFLNGSGANLPTLYQNTTGPTWTLWAGGATNAGGGTADLKPHIFLAKFAGVSSSLRVDGTQVFAGTLGATSLTALSLAAQPPSTDPSNIDISAVAVFNKALAAGEQWALENGWSQKYRIPVAA